MGKKVIIAIFEGLGYNRVFSTLEEASKGLGFHPSTISRAIADCAELNGVRVRYGDRVYAIRKRKENEWKVATEDARGRGFVLLGGMGDRVLKRDVEEMRDITAGWHGICSGARFV